MVFMTDSIRACNQLSRIVIGGQLHSGEKISREFVITCGDGAEVLELIEEALDEVAFAIERKVTLAIDLAVGLGWNDRSDLAFAKGIDERIGVVGLIGN